MLVAVTLSSCGAFRKKAPPPPPALPTAEAQKEQWKYPGEWTGGEKPITSIIVNTDTQRATLYSGEEIVGWAYVASGISSYPTPTGDFSVLEKVKDKVSNLYGKAYSSKGGLINSDFKQGRDFLPAGARFVAAPMKYFMRLTNDGIGMHIGTISRPGRPASHGCIRLPSKMAPILFAHTALGTPVKIVGKGPDYATYQKQSAARARANSAKYAAARSRARSSAEKKAVDAAEKAAGATPTLGGTPAPATTSPTTTAPTTSAPATTTTAPALPAMKEPAAPSLPSVPTPAPAPVPAPTPAPAPAPAPTPAPGTAQ